MTDKQINIDHANRSKKDDAKIDKEVTADLYEKHQKIYPRKVSGIFARLRIIAVVTLLGLYYLLPWFGWGDRQIVLFDLPARQFHIFGMTFWPQDFFYLTGLLIIAAIALFFFTAIAGRLWCGYACPQTVWTEVFMWIERKIEGDRGRQMKLDKAGLSADKIRKKALKHTLWILFSFWTGFTFVGYFSPIRELSVSLLAFSLGPWEFFWIAFFTFATYGNAGWMREQVCMYMCPYARFQGAMFDKDTLVISYDAGRGDPKGSRRKSEDPKAKGLGDCIGCQLCVQVCPTGIDIREGLQYECIGCAACIDVCDEVMEKMEYPKGLIRYTTENDLEGKPTNFLRPKVFIYGFVLVTIIGAMVFSVLNRSPVELDVIRDRNGLYRETNDGMIENTYTLKIMNKDTQIHNFTITANGLPEMKLAAGKNTLPAEPGDVIDRVVSIQVDPEVLKGASSEINFKITSQQDPTISISEEARFLGPNN